LARGRAGGPEPSDRYGRPEIFNTDQAAQFTSAAFTGLLRDQGIRISMDGRGCWRNNIFVVRLRRTIKYEEHHSRTRHSRQTTETARIRVSGPTLAKLRASQIKASEASNQ